MKAISDDAVDRKYGRKTEPLHEIERGKSGQRQKEEQGK
jgi:hypothetical protein